MPTEEIIVTVDEDGNAEIETVGFRGRKCKEVTQELISAMGNVIEEKKKPEYYQPEFVPDKRKVKVQRA